MRGWLLTIMTCLLLVPLPALAQQRHALVVGIDSYAHVAALEKARNDARDVAAALEAAGFRTDLLIDADETALLTALTVFAGRLDPGDEAVFYFAGHGVEIDGRNYLLPADVPDVPPGQELIVMRRSLPVDDVIDLMRRREARLSLLFIDASRENPFMQVDGRALGRARGLGRAEAPEGSFILYSADAGQVALEALSGDDPDRNSLFARVLLPRLSEPGLDLRAMVGQVRAEVRQLASAVGHEQAPAVDDRFDGEFRFMPASAALAAEPDAAPSPAPAADPCAVAVAVWASVQAADSIAALESFIVLYGETCPVLAALAEDRLAALQTPPEAMPEPAPEPAPVPAPDHAGMLAECEEVTHPGLLSIHELAASDLAHAERLCRAALDAMPSESSPDAFQAIALLGRVRHAAGDHAAAERDYRRAAQAGNPLGMNGLGYLYQHGDGVRLDYAEAVRWYRAAAEAGSSYAMNNLGLMYARGHGVAQDYAEAVRLYRAAIAGGNSGALNNLGVMYQQGRGVQQDHDEALRLYRAAAAAGSAGGMSNLGFMYHAGLSVRQDYGEAMRWYRQAVARGGSDGMVNIGFMYEHGHGVSSNPYEAAEWYLRALAAGSAWLLDNLADRQGNVVRALQYQLRDLGLYTGRVDGIAGPATRAALRAYADAN